MCDFKPGDEVVAKESCVSSPLLLSAGQVYLVSRVELVPCPGDEVRVFLFGVPEGDIDPLKAPFYGFPPQRFARAQKRLDSLKIESFMTMPGGYEEPRRKVPEKARTGIKAD
jgi:hypothetical protein